MSRELGAVAGPKEEVDRLQERGALQSTDRLESFTTARSDAGELDRDSTSSRTLAGDEHTHARDDLEAGQQNATSDSQNSPPANKEKVLGAGDGDEKQFLITLDHPFLADKPKLNPQTWNSTYRWCLTAYSGLLVLNATFASSGTSGIVPSIILEYGVSREVAILTIALFVAGYIVGPLFWGPLSETFGRRWIFIVAFIPYICFQVGSALAPNIGSQLAFRFLGGCFAACPLTTSGGLIADIWDADRRGIALAVFALCPFAGPALAPIVSGAIQVTGTDFRWMFWVLTIFGGVCLAGIVLFIPETYMPYLLRREAARIRKETGDQRYRHTSEDPSHKPTLKETLKKTLLKPFIMIFEEPMLLILTLYLALVYGIIYLLFEALPIVFSNQHGLNELQTGLTFLTLPIGGGIAVVFYALVFNRQYMRKHHEVKPKMVPPEERMKVLMTAAPMMPISFFWFGWTAYPHLSIWSPIASLLLLGFGILFVFLAVFNYLIDSYLMNAASALAINTVVRSAFGAGFPMFAYQMYDTLTVPGASSLLGGLLIVFAPAPFILYKYGKTIRSWSKNAMVLD